MKLVVAGGTGYVGHQLVTRAAEEGYDILMLVRKPAEALRRFATQVDYSALANRRIEADALINLAGLAHVRGADLEFDAANRGLPLELAGHAIDGGVRRFVHVSTLGVYGNWSLEPISEEGRPKPETSYARSKLDGDRALVYRFRARPDALTIVRPPMVYGPRCPGNFSRLQRLVMRGWPLPFGAARALRSFMFVDNLVDFLLRCAASDNAGDLYVIGDGSDYSVAELVAAMAAAGGVRLTNLPIPPALLRAFARLAGFRRDMDSLTRPMLVDWTRARESLKWSPPVDADEAMSRALAA
mgnify:CR=1 FL=1